MLTGLLLFLSAAPVFPSDFTVVNTRPAKERGRAAVGFNDDPECVFAEAFAGLGRVNRVCREQPETLFKSFAVAGGVFLAHHAPIAARVPEQTLIEIIRRRQTRKIVCLFCPFAKKQRSV
jgi:hypothetical protein